jgi:hypothetical protein
MLYYILDEHNQPRHVQADEWEAWLDDHPTMVEVTEIGKWHVRTMFKGYVFGTVILPDPPIWETKVIGGPLHDDTKSCGGTKDDALKMHAEMVGRVKKLLEKPQQN